MEPTSAWISRPPDPELRRLDPLVGNWRSHGRTENSILGPGVEMISNECFWWRDGGYFLIQTYETQFGNEPEQTGINYWYYDTDMRRFGIIFFSNSGSFTEAGNRYFGGVDGDVLTMVGPARFDLRLDESGWVRREPDGGIRIDWQLQDETGEFQPWISTALEPR